MPFIAIIHVYLIKTNSSTIYLLQAKYQTVTQQGIRLMQIAAFDSDATLLAILFLFDFLTTTRRESSGVRACEFEPCQAEATRCNVRRSPIPLGLSQCAAPGC